MMLIELYLSFWCLLFYMLKGIASQIATHPMAKHNVHTKSSYHPHSSFSHIIYNNISYYLIHIHVHFHIVLARIFDLFPMVYFSVKRTEMLFIDMF